MIHCIAAIDEKHGIANEEGIPWQGKLPSEVAYYRSKIQGQTILMGSATYKEHGAPPKSTKSYVLTSSSEPLRQGFQKVDSLERFLKGHPDVWVIGGAGVFNEVIDVTEMLYITRVQGNFNCTKFFPEFESDFSLVERSPLKEENGISFHFERWHRK